MPRKKIPLSEREHGLPATYKAGCRCQPCTTAASEYATARAKARQAGDVRTAQGEPKERKHGARSTYKAGCRCSECTAAQTEYNAKRRESARAADANDAPAALTSITLAVSCLKCGGPLQLLADGRPTESGARKVSSFRCADRKCGRQWLLIHVMQSHAGHELMGAA